MKPWVPCIPHNEPVAITAMLPEDLGLEPLPYAHGHVFGHRGFQLSSWLS